MKILQLCKKFPYPLKDGEAIAVTHLSRALRDLGCEITLLTMNTVKHYTDVHSLPEEFDHYQNIFCTQLDNSINAKDAFLNLFSESSYHVDRFISDDFEEKLIEVLTDGDFDIVQLETLYLAPYVATIKKYSKAQVVMRAHNVEHEIWDRIAENSDFWPKKWYLTHLSKKLRNFEVDRLNDYDYLVALTDRDLKKFQKLGYKNGAMAAPIGIDTSSYAKIDRASKSTFSLCFIGSLDWMPNIEGLDWFLTKVWPLIRAKHPNVEFHIAGRNTPASLQNLSLPNVVVHGEVPDAAEFVSSHSAMIVPLLSGSGMRVKILEGMAVGKMIITTTLGLEGINAEDKEHLLIADTPTDYVEAIDFCMAHPEQVSEIGKNAFEFVSEQFDHRKLATKLLEVYEKLTCGEHAH